MNSYVTAELEALASAGNPAAKIAMTAPAIALEPTIPTPADLGMTAIPIEQHKARRGEYSRWRPLTSEQTADALAQHEDLCDRIRALAIDARRTSPSKKLDVHISTRALAAGSSRVVGDCTRVVGAEFERAGWMITFSPNRDADSVCLRLIAD